MQYYALIKYGAATTPAQIRARDAAWQAEVGTTVTQLRSEFDNAHPATTPEEIRARDAAWKAEAPAKIHDEADKLLDHNTALADVRREFMQEQALRGVTGRDADRAFDSFQRNKDLAHMPQEGLEKLATERHERNDDVRRVRQAITARMVAEGVPPNDPRIGREVNNFVRAHEADLHTAAPAEIPRLLAQRDQALAVGFIDVA